MKKRIAISCLLNLTLLSGIAPAHYLWLTVDPKSGDHGTAVLVFEGGPSPGDGFYLDPFISRGTTWIRTAENNSPTVLKLDEQKKGELRWLSAELPAAGPRALDSYGQWGVYKYGDTDVLLHYHAKFLDVNSAAQLELLGRSKSLKLDIVPQPLKDSLQVQVLWDGKPAANRPMAVRGAGGLKENLKTDEKGVVSFTPDKPGRYTLHTSVDLDQDGSFEGKDYQLIRHHGTLVLNLPLAENE